MNLCLSVCMCLCLCLSVTNRLSTITAKRRNAFSLSLLQQHPEWFILLVPAHRGRTIGRKMIVADCSLCDISHIRNNETGVIIHIFDIQILNKNSRDFETIFRNGIYELVFVFTARRCASTVLLLSLIHI